MARDLNIDYNRVITTSIMHTIENGRRFGSFGAMLSLRSQQRREIINSINPKIADEGGRLSHVRVGETPVAKVNMQWRPQRDSAGLSNTRRNKATTIAQAQDEAGVITDDVTYDIHNEWTEKFLQTQLMKLEPAAETYLNAVNKGLSLNNANNAMWQGLAEIGERIFETIETSIFKPLNTSVIAALIAGIGLNMVDGTNALNLPVIALFDEEGRPKPDLIMYMAEIMRIHDLKFRPIVIGGSMLTRYVTALKLSATQDYGYDAVKMLAQLGFEFYYDSTIDGLYGQDQIIITDAGAAALEFLAEHTDVIKAKKVGNTTFTSATISLQGYDTDLTTIDMDLRVIESDDDAYPKLYVVPSLRAGIFVRPQGVIKNYGGWASYTGIFGAKLVRTLG